MQSRGRIVVDAEGAGGCGGGRTRFTELSGQGPLTPRRTGPERVHLVGAVAGPLGGDEAVLEIEVGPGARLELCSAAASIVLAAGAGTAVGTPSRWTVRATVAEGGELWLTPGAVVLTRRARHEARTELTVTAGGRVCARELVVAGRSGEPTGVGRFTTRLDADGRPALRQTITVDDRPGTTGPAVLDGGRAAGQLLVVGVGVGVGVGIGAGAGAGAGAGLPGPTGPRGPRAAWLPTAVEGCALFTATGDPADVERLLLSEALGRMEKSA